MKNPIIPSADEVRNWAYNIESVDPLGQDWDLVIASELSLSVVLFELAADQACPHQSYFLNCLYIFVGNFVRVHLFDVEWKNTIEIIFSTAMTSSDQNILKWLSRAKYLMENPNSFNYPDWYEGRLACS